MPGPSSNSSTAHLLQRLFGEAVDSALFYPLAFYGSGIIPDDKLPLVMLAQFVTKVGVEVVFTPFTYAIVGWLTSLAR